jgi:hypothetical protein
VNHYYIIQVITCLTVLNPNTSLSFSYWKQKALPLLTDREKVVQIMDPSLEGQYSMKDAVQVAAIAAMCVQPEGDYRPLMADVVQSLVPLVKNRPAPKSAKPLNGS